MRMALLFMLLSAAISAHSANILANPDMEMGGATTVTGWNNHVAVGQYEFEVAGNAHSGERCIGVRCVGDPGCGRWYTTDLYLLGGATYRVEAWVRTEGDATAQLSLPFAGRGVERVVRDNPNWTRVEGEFTVPDTRSYGLYLQNLGTGAAFYDDVTVELVSAPPSDAGGPVPTDGKPIVGIVTPDAALPHHVYLALETQRILKAMTGAAPGITSAGSAPQGDAGRFVWIGVTPSGSDYASKLALVGDEGIVLDIGPDAIVCLGNTPRGEYYAVQEFYHEIGCRWCWPGKDGEVIPKVGTLSLSPRMIVHRPSFDLRGGHTIQVYHTPPDWTPKHVNTTEWADWAARNRMNRLKASYTTTWDHGAIRGGQVDEVAGHTLYTMLPPEKWFETHPEYYTLVRGKRTATHSSGRPSEICVSNPDLPRIFADIICDFFAAHPSAIRYCVNAEDEPSYWCECEDCKALDPVPQDWSKNGEGSMHLTDRWLTFINRIAELVEEKYPDKYVATFAYGSSHKLPHKVKPRRNVMIELCWWDQCFKHDIEDPACEVNAEGMELFRGWSRLAPIALYRYLDYHHLESPGAYQRFEQDILRTTHAAGCRYLSDEWDTTFNASPLLLNYRARLQWDVNTDLETFTDDFANRVYGKAGPEIARYFRLLDQAVLEAPTHHVSMNNLGKFTPEILRQGHAILDFAAAAAGDDDTVLARIDRLRYSLLFAELDQIEAAAPQKPELYPALAAVQERIWQLVERRDIEPILGYYGKLGREYKPPVQAMSGRRVVQLPERWLFRTDPDGVGETAGWSAAVPDANWKPISILSPWEGQGYEGYDGDAWYSVEVDVPEIPDPRVWLYCEAVDETFKLWINGEYAGASDGDPGLLWDKPVAVDITGKLKPGARNRLTMKVHDIGYAGGIWKPVWITAGE